MLSIGLGYDPGYLTRQVGKGAENYYLSSVGEAERGEPPGFWSGRACAELGFVPGQPVDADAFERLYRSFADPRHPAFGDPAVPEADKPTLGSRPARFTEQSGRKPVYFLDLTFSPPKSVTLLHAGLLAKAAEQQHDHPEEAFAWRAQAELVWEAVMAGNAAMLEYYQDVCGVSRAGKHGPKVAGRSTGRWVDAPRWVVASFRQHTSRNGDPQLHVHNPVLNRVPCDIDGKWRALDSRAIHAVRPAAAALAERVMWETLTRSLPVRTRARDDGHGLEVEGIADELIGLFSSRRVEVSGLLEQLCAQYVARHGRRPSARALFSMAQYATRATKARKSKAQAPTHASELDQWMRQSRQAESGTLAEVPERVLRSDADPETIADLERAAALARHVLNDSAGGGEASGAESALDAQIDDVLQAAVADVQQARAVFSRYEVMRAINRHLPGRLGGLTQGAVRQLLETLTERAIGPGNPFGVRLLNLPELIDVPEVLRRSDGSSAYVAPCADRFTTDDQLAVENRLLAAAQAHTAPALPHRRVQEWLAPRRAEAGGPGLREDQAAAILGIATSGRAVDVFEGPAGSGKSYTLGRLTGLWRAVQGVGSIGLTLSTNASYVLAEEGFDRAYNIRRFLALHQAGRLRLEPGTLIVVDEASMVPTADLAAIQQVADRSFCKVVWAGDTAQLSAPEAGGLMRVLAADAGSHALTTVERMEAAWEREASLRLRAGHASVLDAYDEHGRILSGDREQITARLVADYLDDRAAGRRTVMLTMANADARDLSVRVRAELVRRGEVDADGVRLRDGTTAGAGDLVMARANTRRVNVAGTWRTLSNRDVLRVHRVLEDGALIAHLTSSAHPGGDPARRVYLPARYAARHLELGYASTAHAAQGRTVDVARALIDGRVTHQMLYVMLTRGRSANLAYVDTSVLTAADLREGAQQAPQLAGPDPAPGAPTLNARTVLAHVLERDDAGPAAVEALRQESERVTHMAHLMAIWRDLITLATRPRHRQALAAALTPDEFDRLHQDPARRTLYRLLQRIELAGGDTRHLITRAARRRPFDDARSIAQVLHHRLTRLLTTIPTTTGGGAPSWQWRDRIPHIDDPDLARTALEVAERMDQRTEQLGQRAAHNPPEWALRQLGQVPDEPLLRHEWIVRAGVIAAYGEAYGTFLLTDRRPGPLDPDRDAAWHAAHHALHHPRLPNRAAERPSLPPGRLDRPPSDRHDGTELAPAGDSVAAMRQAGALLALSHTPYQVGLLDHADLTARAGTLAAQARQAAVDLTAAEQRARTYTSAGGGPAERELLARRDQLTTHLQHIDAATTAQERLQQAQQQREHARSDTLEAVHQQVRAAAEQARRALAQAPPRTVWPLIRHQHRQLTRHWDSMLHDVRHTDIQAAQHEVATAHTTQQQIRGELDAIQREIARRAALPPARHRIEQAARDHHHTRQRLQHLLTTLTNTPDQVGLLDDRQLTARIAELRHRAEELHAAERTAAHDLAHWSQHGGGPCEQNLHHHRQELQTQLNRINAAHQAAQHRDREAAHIADLTEQNATVLDRIQQIRHELRTGKPLLPKARARRAALESELGRLFDTNAQLLGQLQQRQHRHAAADQTARTAADQAPPAPLWPQIRHRAAALDRTWPQTLEQARATDQETGRRHLDKLRRDMQRLDLTLHAALDESERRSTLARTERQAEQAVRREHQQRLHETQQTRQASRAATPSRTSYRPDRTRDVNHREHEPGR
ncbi:putative TraA-like conjugal transfer protein [[Actinomadura] parvosata subsp. kistnae]|uniref:MobF family relaxase n=1 Tax=[Actinomadura] parvosata TaxID=1955412 RepID=UPI000D2C0FD0|nr:putative TraA-like conjugal transfer protein [Actinomadura parvosata subsp. kistnae]